MHKDPRARGAGVVSAFQGLRAVSPKLRKIKLPPVDSEQGRVVAVEKGLPL